MTEIQMVIATVCALVALLLWAIAAIIGAIWFVLTIINTFKGVESATQKRLRDTALEIGLIGMIVALPVMLILGHAVTGKWIY